MTQLLDQTRIDGYLPPALDPLGSLRALTRGAGPGGKPIVTATGGARSGDGPFEAAAPDASAIRPNAQR